MLAHVISSSIVISGILLIRMLFREKVPNRLIYLIWAIAFIHLVLPVSLFNVSLPTQTDSYSQTEVELYVSDSNAQSVINTADKNKTDDPSILEHETQSPSSNANTIKQKADISWNTVAKTVYLVGFACVIIWIVASEVLVYIKLKKSRQLFRKDGFIKIYTSNSDISPCTFGFLPTIYITEKISKSASMDLVLAHEKAHLKQLDNYRSILRKLAAAVYWFNPLVWIYVIFATRDAELSCDEAVIANLSEKQRFDYAKMIFDYAPKSKNSVSRFGGKPMKKRITAITIKTKFRTVSTTLAIILAFSALMAGFIGCTNENPTESSLSDAPVSLNNDVEMIAMPSNTSPDIYNSYDSEHDMYVLPSKEYRQNESFIRACPGGMRFSYETLTSMTSDKTLEKIFTPAFKQYEILHLGIPPKTSIKVAFYDYESKCTAEGRIINDERFPTYESFIYKTRKYFSADITAQLLESGSYFEFSEEFFVCEEGVRAAWLGYYGIEIERISASETEIKYRGTARYLIDEKDILAFENDNTLSFPDEKFEKREIEYTLSLQDGRWVFTEFTLPY